MKIWMWLFFEMVVDTGNNWILLFVVSDWPKRLCGAMIIQLYLDLPLVTDREQIVARYL